MYIKTEVLEKGENYIKCPVYECTRVIEDQLVFQVYLIFFNNIILIQYNLYRYNLDYSEHFEKKYSMSQWLEKQNIILSLHVILTCHEK